MKKLLSVILVAVLLLGIIPFTVFAEVDKGELFINENYTVTLGEGSYDYSFTPQKDGCYRFISSSEQCDTYAILYNSNYEVIYECNPEFTMNFDFTYYLYSENTYYLSVGSFDEAFMEATFEFKVVETAGIDESDTGRTQFVFDETYRVTTDMRGREYYLNPSEDGRYKFYSKSDEHYTFAVLYNSDGTEIFRCSPPNKMNFEFTYYLNADTVYYLKVGAMIVEDGGGTFKFYANKTTEDNEDKDDGSDNTSTASRVVQADISMPPTNNTCMRGLERETIDLTNMEVTFTLSDGKKVLWAYDKDIGLDFDRKVSFSISYDNNGYYVCVVCERATDLFYFNTIEPSNTVEASNIKLSDIDGDDCISIIDASVAQRNIAKIETLETQQQGSNGTNLYSTNIQRYAAKLI